MTLWEGLQQFKYVGTAAVLIAFTFGFLLRDLQLSSFVELEVTEGTSLCATPDTKVAYNHQYLCDTAIGIISNPRHSDRILKLNETWLNHICNNGQHIVVYADEPSTDAPKFGFIESVVAANCSDSFKDWCCRTNFLLKTLWEKYPSAKWFFKVKDDNFVIPRNIANLLKKLNPDKPTIVGRNHYILFENSTSQMLGNGSPDMIEAPEGTWRVRYPAGNFGYILSRALLQKLLSDDARLLVKACHLGYYDDVTIGLAAAAVDGTTFTNAPGFLYEPITQPSLGDFLDGVPLTFDLRSNTEHIVEWNWLLNRD